MKNIIIPLAFVLVYCISFGQTNLIQDSGFENDFTYWTQEDDGAEEFLCFICQPSYYYGAYWDFNACNCTVSIEPPNVFFGTQNVFEGIKFAGIMALNNYEEDGTLSGKKAKIGYQLNSSLDQSKEYVLIFRVSKMDNSTAQPFLKVALNNHFSDPMLGNETVFQRYIINDGSPQNTQWEEVKVIFRPSDSDSDWLIFKVSNDFIGPVTKWGGVYLDDVRLYEACDYFSSLNGSGCLQSSGSIVVVPEPLANSPTILYHWFDDPFHIRNLDNVSRVRMKIVSVGGVEMKTIEVSSKNGIWQPIYWDGLQQAGAEAAAGWYHAEVDAWNGDEGRCNHQNFNFNFEKLNSDNQMTEPVNNDLTHNGTLDLNGPAAYNWCCSYLPEMSLNNLHYSQNQIGSWGIVGGFYYKALNKITFGPNVTVDPGVYILLKAPNIITITSGSHISGIVQAQLSPCAQRVANPNLPIISNTIVTETTENLNLLIDSLRAANQKINTLGEAILYPNPTDNGHAKIYFKERLSKTASVSIYNIFGQCISNEVTTTNDEYKIDLTTYIRGIYLVKINVGSFSKTFKLIYNNHY